MKVKINNLEKKTQELDKSSKKLINLKRSKTYHMN